MDPDPIGSGTLGAVESETINYDLNPTFLRYFNI
jgi:hypothetical protein